tara:strand:+ start:36148 stop:36792 length:645 start_codon:yes stop_codon:yes gene_type:complete
MRINSQSSQFVFNLPSDLIPQSIIDRYRPIMEKNWIQYENVLDYLNSTIKELAFPGMALVLPSQTMMRGKQRNYRPVTNINDVTTTRELSIVFRRVDSDLNYFILRDIFDTKYLDVLNTFAEPFQMTSLDIHRDAIYRVNYREIILSNISEIVFAYNQQTFNEQTFTMTFNYNFYEIEFILNNEKVLELEPDELPSIQNRNWKIGDITKLNPPI